MYKYVIPHLHEKTKMVLKFQQHIENICLINLHILDGYYDQLIQKDPEAAIVLFWKAINAGDRVDSALKDMAVVMKQLDRSEEAIEAIKSFRGLCSRNAQESLDNVLIDLYKVINSLMSSTNFSIIN